MQQRDELNEVLFSFGLGAMISSGIMLGVVLWFVL